VRAESTFVLAAFAATYLIFHGQQQLRALPSDELGQVSKAVLVGKSDRLAVKQDEEAEDEVFSPKLVRLESYYRPADYDLNSPKWDHISYLADYVYSEVPPKNRPVDTVRDALKDIPIGTPIEEIKRASEVFGLDFNFMKAVAKIESGFDPKQRTGSYIGLFQLSKHEFATYGSGDILNARDNALAAAYKFATSAMLLELSTHKKATFSDLYLIHQQGTRGAEEHAGHPERLAVNVRHGGGQAEGRTVVQACDLGKYTA